MQNDLTMILKNFTIDIEYQFSRDHVIQFRYLMCHCQQIIYTHQGRFTETNSMGFFSFQTFVIVKILNLINPYMHLHQQSLATIALGYKRKRVTDPFLFCNVTQHSSASVFTARHLLNLFTIIVSQAKASCHVKLMPLCRWSRHGCINAYPSTKVL